MSTQNLREERAPGVPSPSKKVTMVAKQPGADEVNTVSSFFFIFSSVKISNIPASIGMKCLNDMANSI